MCSIIQSVCLDQHEGAVQLIEQAKELLNVTDSAAEVNYIFIPSMVWNMKYLKAYNIVHNAFIIYILTFE